MGKAHDRLGKIAREVLAACRLIQVLQRFQDEVFTIGNHIANIIVKADGLVAPLRQTFSRRLLSHLSRLSSNSRQEKRSNPFSNRMRETFLPAGGLLSRSDNGNNLDAPVLVPETDNSGPGLEESMATLDGLIGLGAVKKKVHELASFLQMQQQREKMGLPSSSHGCFI